jgi:hypothetical protein
MRSQDFPSEFNLLIRAKYPLIYVVTAEEECVEKTIAIYTPNQIWMFLSDQMPIATLLE